MSSISKEFIYSQNSVKPSTIWLTFLLLGWSYGSMKQVGLQILYYLTFGGFGIWTLIRLFTLNSAIKKYNQKVATQAGFNEDEIKSLGFSSITNSSEEIRTKENNKAALQVLGIMFSVITLCLLVIYFN